MEYYFKTDFQIVETFTDSTGVPIDLNNFDFELIYQTTGVNNYKASKKGTTFINCAIDETDSSKLNVIFQDHRLGCGQLHREIKIKVLNPLFEDYQQIMTHPFTEIYLVQNGGDQTTGYASAGIPIVLPYSETIVTDLSDTDYFFGMSLSLKSFIKITWLDIKAKLKTYFDAIFEPKKAATDLYVTQAEKNTWSGKQDALTFSTNIETDKESTTKITAIKTFYDWAVGKFIDLTKIVTTWTATTLNTNIPSEKLVKDSLDLKAEINHDHNNVYEPANANIQSHIGDGDIHVTSLQKSDFHAHTNKTALDAVEGVNTGDQSSSDFDIKDLSDTTNLRSTWSGKQDALTFSTNIETDKESTTKITAIKTFYDWAVAKFLLATKLVTSWSGTPSHENIPSEKLVKDSLDLKADITPATGATSALRALFTSVPNANCVYNTATGYYEMNGVTNLTELDVMKSYHYLQAYKNEEPGAYQQSGIRTNFYLGNNVNALYTCKGWCQNETKLEVFKFYIYNWITGSTIAMFSGCSNLRIAETFRMESVNNASNMFFGCTALVTAYLYRLNINVSFAWSPLISLASLQYLVTNRGNETTRITITVHATVWSKLNDAVNYPEWNALLVDAVANQYINFASA